MADQDSIPWQVADLAVGVDVEFVWENELGGRTFRVGDRFVKWNPYSTGIDLRREDANLRWLSGRHWVPKVVDFGSDREGQWLVTAAMPGESAIADRWRSDPDTAVRAIATGLRLIHAIDMGEFPALVSAASWATRTPEHGEGFQDAFFTAYGIDPDPVRLAYYRSLWHLES